MVYPMQQNPWQQIQQPFQGAMQQGGLGQLMQNNNWMNNPLFTSPASMSAGARLGESANNAGASNYGWNTQANMNLLNNQYGRANLQDELANLLQRAQIGSGDTRYTADQQLAGTKETAGASKYGSLADLLGVRYGADTQRGIATEGQQFGRANLLDQLGLQKYLGDVGANTERYGFDTGFNIAQEQAGADRYGSLADALLGRYRADTDLSGLKYMSDAELKGLGVQGDTARDVARIQSETSLLPQLLGLALGQQKFNSIFPLISGMIPQLSGMANMGIPPQFSAN